VHAAPAPDTVVAVGPDTTPMLDTAQVVEAPPPPPEPPPPETRHGLSSSSSPL